MKPVISLFKKITMVLSGIILCQNVFAIDYPDIVYPEDATYESITLSDGSNAILTSHWAQKMDYLSTDATDYPFFAVSGDFLFVYDKNNNKILKFNRMTGLHIEDLTINFGTFNEHKVGYMGADDAQNLFISTSYSESYANYLNESSITLPNSNLIISVIDNNGNVTQQYVSDVLSMKQNNFKDKLTFNVNYSFVNIKGDITKSKDFLVSLPVLAYNKTEGTYVSYVFFQQIENNKLIDINNSNVFRYLDDTSNKNVQITYFSFSPALWVPGKAIKNYIRENNEYFIGVTSYALNGTHSNYFYSTATNRHNVLAFEGTNFSGASCFKYGDLNMIVDAVYNSPVLNEETGNKENFVTFNIRELSCGVDYSSNSNITTSKKILYTVPQRKIFPLPTDIIYYPFTRTQVVESTENGNPRADIYLYAPGRGMAYYTLANKSVSTGTISPISNDKTKFEYKNGTIKADISSSIQIYNVSGMLVESIIVPQTGNVSIAHLPSGFYILSSGNSRLKIFKN